MEIKPASPPDTVPYKPERRIRPKTDRIRTGAYACSTSRISCSHRAISSMEKVSLNGRFFRGRRIPHNTIAATSEIFHLLIKKAMISRHSRQKYELFSVVFRAAGPIMNRARRRFKYLFLNVHPACLTASSYGIQRRCGSEYTGANRALIPASCAALP